MSGIANANGVPVTPQADILEVPVLLGHDSTMPIGRLRIRRDALPPTPTFGFAIGYRALAAQAGTVPPSAYVGPYELKEVSLVCDETPATPTGGA